jgi:hypothetical protein
LTKDFFMQAMNLIPGDRLKLIGGGRRPCFQTAAVVLLAGLLMITYIESHPTYGNNNVAARLSLPSGTASRAPTINRQLAAPWYYAAPGHALAENHLTSKEKGKNSMQPSAAALGPDLPRLDVTQPSRVETFTFGLG